MVHGIGVSRYVSNVLMRTSFLQFLQVIGGPLSQGPGGRRTYQAITTRRRAMVANSGNTTGADGNDSVHGPQRQRDRLKAKEFSDFKQSHGGIVFGGAGTKPMGGLFDRNPTHLWDGNSFTFGYLFLEKNVSGRKLAAGTAIGQLDMLPLWGASIPATQEKWCLYFQAEKPVAT